MPVFLQTKYGKRILATIGCFVVWLLYTLIFRQIIRFDSNNIPVKNLDSKHETYEIDERVSVCFKDVAPFSMLLKQDANACRNIRDLLIVVHTDPTNFQLRARFRKTLRNVKKEAMIHNLQIDGVFMLGLNRDQCISSLLLQEMSLEKDILISSIIDSSENQTLKSVNTLKWFHENCSNSKLLLKLDAKMDPSTSFTANQFYKLIKSSSTQDIVLLGSRNVPNVLFNSPVSYFSVPTTSVDPISAQYLHLNYLLSRNVVMSLLKARADAINISAWKEDLFVTGVLANVAQIRPKHDERFLRQCAGTLCIFCECPIDLERQIDFSQPYYFAQSLTRRKESARLLEEVTQTDSAWSKVTYEPTTETDPTVSTSAYGAETSSEFTTITSTMPSFSEATTNPQNEFTTHFKSIGEEITSTGSTPTNKIPDSTTFFSEKTDTTSEISSQLTEWYTTTGQSIQTLESEDFIVTAITPNEINYFPTEKESLGNEITNLGILTNDIEKLYFYQEDSPVTEIYNPQSSIIAEFDMTLRTTSPEAYDLYPTTASNEKIETTVPHTISHLNADSKTISTYPTTDHTKSTETEYDADVTSSIFGEMATTIVLPNAEDEFQQVDEQRGLFSTSTVGTTTLNFESTTPTYLYSAEDGISAANPEADSSIGDSWSEPENFIRTTTKTTGFQTETVESSSVHADNMTEDSLKATTRALDADSKLLFEAQRPTAHLKEFPAKPVLKSISSNLNDITTDLSLNTNFHMELSIPEMNTVVENVILEATLRDAHSETTEYYEFSTCNPVSTPKVTEFLTISTLPNNAETTQIVSNNGSTLADFTTETAVLPKESLQNRDKVDEIESATEIFFNRFNISSHVSIQGLSNQTNFVNNTLKTLPANLVTNLVEAKTDLTTETYLMIISKVNHDSSLISEKDNINKVTQVPITKEFEISPSEKDLEKSDTSQTTVPRRRAQIRISSSTSKSEISRLKSVSGRHKIQVRVTSSTSIASKGKKKVEHRKQRRKRKVKKIMIRIRKVFMKLPTTKMSGFLKKSTDSILNKKIIA